MSTWVKINCSWVQLIEVGTKKTGGFKSDFETTC